MLRAINILSYILTRAAISSRMVGVAEVFEIHEECVGRQGRWYGKDRQNNNKADTPVVVHALEFVGGVLKN